MASSMRLMTAAPSGVSSQMRRMLAWARSHSTSMVASGVSRGTFTPSTVQICTTFALYVLKSPATILPTWLGWTPA